jgi:hypothetical protein
MNWMTVLIFLFVVGVAMPTGDLCAQIPVVDIVQKGVKKVIKAVDLKIQRLQNKTIWLQNAQKTIENKMQALKLFEIKDWVERQRELYADYYEELWKVKSVLTYSYKVKEVINIQLQIVKECKSAYSLFSKDEHFTTIELQHFQNFYSVILANSLSDLDQLYMVVSSYSLQITDGARLQQIDATVSKLQDILGDLRQFNNGNVQVSFQRAKDKFEIDQVRILYGLK